MLRLHDMREYVATARRSGCCLCIGVFDGFHVGHREVVQACIHRARSGGLDAVMLTFEPHPLELLAPGRAPRRLTTPDRRAELLEEFGVDGLIEHPFTRELASMDAEQFVAHFVVEGFHARHVVVGIDFRFGRARAGDESMLRRLGSQHGFEVIAVDEFMMNGVAVSSSRIRTILERKGDARAAASLLGRPHRIHGEVVRGQGRGRKLGFPTANVERIAEIVPAPGIYACEADLEGKLWPAAVHVGPRLSFDGDSTVEAHLAGHDASRDLYGARLRLDVLDRLRSPERFDSPDALVAQIRDDVRRTVEIVVGDRRGATAPRGIVAASGG